MRAIETEYAGTMFRSRLEAKWAEFFDYLSVKWAYEGEGYTDGSTNYLPDFWLPDVSSRGQAGGVFFEVKPTSATQGEAYKAQMLAKGSGRPVIIPSDSPSEKDQECLDEYIWIEKCVQFDSGLQFARCALCGHIDIGFYSSDEPWCKCGIGTYNPGDPTLRDARTKFPNFGRWKAKA